MPTDTTVAAAINYLVTTLPAAVPSGTKVFDGRPTEYPAASFVAVVGWHLDQAPATLGGPVRFQLEEDYVIDMVLRTFVGDSMSSARTNGIALYNAVQDTVRADPTLGGAVRVSWLERFKAEQGPTSLGGFALEAELGLHCEARLS